MAGQMDLFLEKLPEREEKRLAELEGVIRKNLKSFFAVGMALKEIKESRLYRGTHWTFEEYVKDIFEIGKSSAYRYVGAADVLLNIAPGVELLDNDSCTLSPMGDKVQEQLSSKIIRLDNETINNLPNERQLRPLTKLKPEEQKNVWQQAKETAPDGKLTAKHIQKTIFDIIGTPEKKMAENRRQARNNERLDPGFREAFASLLLQVEKARHEKYKNTSWEEVMRHLDGLREIVAEDGTRTFQDMVPRMEKKDRQKLLAAGYRVFRLDMTRALIEEQAKDGSWFVHVSFEVDDPAIVYAFDELMTNDKHLRG